MRNKISFLAMLAFALNVNYVCASECIGEDCELVFEESTDILVPAQYEVNWIFPSVSATETEKTCYYDYNCPFETPEECAVWYKKPSYKIVVAPRAPHINSEVAWDMEQIALSNPTVSANDEYMKPLVQRYHMLMNASEACCTAGILYKMRQNGADDKEIYEFLKDDANYFAITKRCLVMDDNDIISKYSKTVDGKMVADVRNACLCKNYQWFDSLLQPFLDMYESVPKFQLSKFTYKYTDGLQREINVPINTDVQKVIGMTAACPK